MPTENWSQMASFTVLYPIKNFERHGAMPFVPYVPQTPCLSPLTSELRT